MSGPHLNVRNAALAARGTKQTCTNEACQCRFYDLKRVPCACPYCGIRRGARDDNPPIAIVNFETFVKPPRRSSMRAVEPKRPPIEIAKKEEKAEVETELPSIEENLLIEDEDDDASEKVSANDADEAI